MTTKDPCLWACEPTGPFDIITHIKGTSLTLILRNLQGTDSTLRSKSRRVIVFIYFILVLGILKDKHFSKQLRKVFLTESTYLLDHVSNGSNICSDMWVSSRIFHDYSRTDCNLDRGLQPILNVVNFVRVWLNQHKHLSGKLQISSYWLENMKIDKWWDEKAGGCKFKRQIRQGVGQRTFRLKHFEEGSLNL
jgi:hypothetical protein